MFRLGYNTNGFAHHRPEDALRVLADLGYRGVAITPDVGPLDPLAPDLAVVGRLRRVAEELDLRLDVETGARFVLDPARKHFPTLLEACSGDRQRRIKFLCRSVDLASELGAQVVSLWAGQAPGGQRGDKGGGSEELWQRLIEGLNQVLAHAAEKGVQVGFEPEPGMFIERPIGYRQLVEKMGATGVHLGLTLDVGHCVCTGDSIAESVHEFADRLVAVQLNDQLKGVHDHIMFGSGELDLPGALGALRRAGFEGLAAVELSRDSHRAPHAAAEAMEHLEQALDLTEDGAPG